MCLSALLACVCMHHVHAGYMQMSEEFVGSPRNKAIDCRESSYGFWEPNSGPLQEQEELLIIELSSLEWPGPTLLKTEAGDELSWKIPHPIPFTPLDCRVQSVWLLIDPSWA